MKVNLQAFLPDSPVRMFPHVGRSFILGCAVILTFLAGARTPGSAQTLTVEGSNSPYTYNGPGTNSYSSILVGDTGTGVLNHAGGILYGDTDSTNPGGIELGRGVGSNGTYNLSGLGYANAGSLIIGDQGTGTFNQSGAASYMSVNSNLYLASVTPTTAGTGTYNLSGGTLYVNLGGTYIGSGTATVQTNRATFTQSGGVANLGQYISMGNGT